MKNRIKEAREWLKTKDIHGSPIVYDINNRSQDVEDLLVEFAETKQQSPMFTSIEEFESFAREYSDKTVTYERGNQIDFVAHIELRGSGDLLSFIIEFGSDFEVIETDEHVHKSYMNDTFNMSEAMREIDPEIIFEKFPERIKLMIP